MIIFWLIVHKLKLTMYTVCIMINMCLSITGYKVAYR